MVDNKDLTVNFLPSPTWNRLGVNQAKIRSVPVDGWNSIPVQKEIIEKYTNISDSKIKKSDSDLVLELDRNKDILFELGKLKTKQVLVGFAAETDDLIANAQKKLAKKNLDFIVANDLKQEGAGFAGDTNIAKLLFADGNIEELPIMTKNQLSKEIYDKFHGENNLVIDIHTTTSNMGKSIVLTKINSFNLKLISFLQDLHKDLKVFYWQESEDLAFLNTISPLGFAIEMGPVGNNVLDCKIIEDTLVLVEDILDFAEKYNKNILPSLNEEITLYEGVDYLYYPKDETGERFGYIHDEFQNMNFKPLNKGDRIFKTHIDTNLEYKGEDGLIPLFINEVAYYEKNIACCLAKKITAIIED